ncbi:MAG TPA: thioredoxin domain-containing protein [Allosphingosinicella sp.]|nr:thioredoxin domain-containing protein [Allosphingosinicella sp.]
MKRARILAAALAAAATLALPAASPAAQRGSAAAARDWTQVAARTPEGGYRLGNPNAQVKLVEYLSLTCPHCAEFAHESSTPLFNQYVRSGRVSVEYRNYYLNGLDVAAALLTRCAAPRAYFNLTHALLASQATWMGRIQSLTEAQRTELGALRGTQAAQRLVEVIGLDAIAARHGVTARMRRTCINQANLNGLEALHAGGQRLGVGGTPTFFINGRALDTNSWAGIEPLLRGR